MDGWMRTSVRVCNPSLRVCQLLKLMGLVFWKTVLKFLELALHRLEVKHKKFSEHKMNQAEVHRLVKALKFKVQPKPFKIGGHFGGTFRYIHQLSIYSMYKGGVSEGRQKTKPLACKCVVLVIMQNHSGTPKPCFTLGLDWSAYVLSTAIRTALKIA